MSEIYNALMQHAPFKWTKHTMRGYDWQEVEGKDCRIVLEPRQDYCDRGNFLAKLVLTPKSELAREIDEQDGWPRYYFSEERAKLEVEAWLIKRGQVK